jgi:hypothetical protein
LLKADEVTVRMLVANTAGYIDYVRVQDFLDLELKEPFRTFTDQELIAYSVRDGKMNFPPGSSQQYSHTDNVISDRSSSAPHTNPCANSMTKTFLARWA